MCLRNITKTYEKPSRKAIIAYKLLHKITNFDGSSHLESPFRYFKLTTKYQKADEHNVSFDYPLVLNREEFYTSGFHCYKTKEDALRAAECLIILSGEIHPVYIKYIQYEGLDGTNGIIALKKIPNYVAKEIRLLTKKELEKLNGKTTIGETVTV